MTAAAILKIEKSPYLRNGSADLYHIWHGDTFQPFDAADH